MFFVIPEMPSKTFVMVQKKLPDHFKSPFISALFNFHLCPWICPFLSRQWNDSQPSSTYLYYNSSFLGVHNRNFFILNQSKDALRIGMASFSLYFKQKRTNWLTMTSYENVLHIHAQGELSYHLIKVPWDPPISPRR